MDFARAYDESGSPQRTEDLVIQGLAALHFGAAGDEVEAYYDKQISVAAA